MKIVFGHFQVFQCILATVFYKNLTFFVKISLWFECCTEQLLNDCER